MTPAGTPPSPHHLGSVVNKNRVTSHHRVRAKLNNTPAGIFIPEQGSYSEQRKGNFQEG